MRNFLFPIPKFYLHNLADLDQPKCHRFNLESKAYDVKMIFDHFYLFKTDIYVHMLLLIYYNVFGVKPNVLT